MSHTVTTQKDRTFRTLLLAVAIGPDEIGRRIKAAREKRGWTQLQFAMEANVSPSSVQRWEGGRLPPVRELVRIAEILGVTTDELVEPDGTVSFDDEDRLRAIVHEELAGVRETMARIEELLEAPTQGRRAST